MLRTSQRGVPVSSHTSNNFSPTKNGAGSPGRKQIVSMQVENIKQIANVRDTTTKVPVTYFSEKYKKNNQEVDQSKLIQWRIKGRVMK